MADLRIADADIIFCSCGYCRLFSSPILSGWRSDVYHTSTLDVALVRIYNAALKCAAPGWLEIQDAKMTQKSTTLGIGPHSSSLTFPVLTFPRCSTNLEILILI